GLYIPSSTLADDVAAMWTCGTQSADMALPRRLTWTYMLTWLTHGMPRGGPDPDPAQTRSRPSPDPIQTRPMTAGQPPLTGGVRRRLTGVDHLLPNVDLPRGMPRHGGWPIKGCHMAY
nr:hypothetical protein [Tanacetum cinerariifolium]